MLKSRIKDLSIRVPFRKQILSGLALFLIESQLSRGQNLLEFIIGKGGNRKSKQRGVKRVMQRFKFVPDKFVEPGAFFATK